MDFGSTGYIVDLIGLFTTNFTTNASVRVRDGDTLGVWTSDTGTMFNFIRLVNRVAGKNILQFVYKPSPFLMKRYVEITINDPGNSDGYLQAGSLWIGKLFVPTYPASWGLTYGIADRSQRLVSDGGQAYPVVYDRPRRLTFSLDYLTDTEVSTYVRPFDYICGVEQNMVFIPSLAMAPLATEAILGTIVAMEEIERRHPNVHSRRYVVEERL